MIWKNHNNDEEDIRSLEAAAAFTPQRRGDP
jgi:hypothetical protein